MYPGCTTADGPRFGKQRNTSGTEARWCCNLEPKRGAGGVLYPHVGQRWSVMAVVSLVALWTVSCLKRICSPNSAVVIAAAETSNFGLLSSFFSQQTLSRPQ